MYEHVSVSGPTSEYICSYYFPKPKGAASSARSLLKISTIQLLYIRDLASESAGLGQPIGLLFNAFGRSHEAEMAS